MKKLDEENLKNIVNIHLKRDRFNSEMTMNVNYFPYFLDVFLQFKLSFIKDALVFDLSKEKEL